MPQKVGLEAVRPSGSQAKYGERQKLFGQAAERISREEYDAVVEEICRKGGDHFQKLQAPEQLIDKPDFGDIDLVALADAQYDEDFFHNIFGEDLIQYHHTKHSSLYQILLRLESGKQVQVDFMKAQDEADFESKRVYYSKGHLSPMVGILAQNLHFKYGTEGFSKRYEDSKGQWHDVLVAKDLTDGLQILGYDLTTYEAVKTNDDIPAFVASSPYFEGKYYEPRNLARRHREAMRRIARQEDLRARIIALGETQEVKERQKIEDEDHFFKDEKLFPGKYKEYTAKTEEIEEQIRQRSEERAQRLRESRQMR